MKNRRLVGERIRLLRLRKNFSQEGLAQTLGIAHATVSSWERGSRPMSLDMLFRLAKVFGVSPCIIVNTDASPCDRRQQILASCEGTGE